MSANILGIGKRIVDFYNLEGFGCNRKKENVHDIGKIVCE